MKLHKTMSAGILVLGMSGTGYFANQMINHDFTRIGLEDTLRQKSLQADFFDENIKTGEQQMRYNLYAESSPEAARTTRAVIDAYELERTRARRHYALQEKQLTRDIETEREATRNACVPFLLSVGIMAIGFVQYLRAPANRAPESYDAFRP